MLSCFQLFRSILWKNIVNDQMRCVKYRQSRPAQIYKHHIVQSFGGRKKLSGIEGILSWEGILKQSYQINPYRI